MAVATMAANFATLQVNARPSLVSRPNESMVADPTLADYGRQEIDIAAQQMPGLLELVRMYEGQPPPLEGARISGSMHMTVQTAALIEALRRLGADIRWCSSNIYSTQDHAAAAVARDRLAAVFAHKGEDLEQYWDYTDKALTWPDGTGPHFLIDAGGDLSLLVHEGAKVEKNYAETGYLPDPERVTSNPEFQIVLRLIRNGIQRDPKKWHKIAERIVCVTEETTTGIRRLSEYQKRRELLFPAVNIDQSVTKTLFDSYYGIRHSIVDAMYRATDILLSGKLVVISGYGTVGKACAYACKAAGARVVITEIDPICALQASMEGFRVKALEDTLTRRPTKIVSKADIFIAATGNQDVITAKLMASMKNNAIVCNVGRFDMEIDMEGLVRACNAPGGGGRENIKPQVDRWVFPDGHGVIVLAHGRLMNIGCAPGHPSFAMSCISTSHAVTVIDRWNHGKPVVGKKELTLLDRVLDEKVARVHLPSAGAQLSFLTDAQCKRIDVNPDGPYKPEHYDY